MKITAFKRALAVCASAALLLTVSPLSPATASEPTPDKVVSAFGYVQAQPNGTFLESDVMAVKAASNASAAVPEALLARAADPAYVIYSRWNDNLAKPTVIRNGTAAFGWAHVQKHRVTLNMVKKTTMFPKTRSVQGGNTIVYQTPANEYECWLGICRIKRTMDVRTVVSNTRMGDGLQKGVITTYCVGPMTCPAWVAATAG